MLTKRYFLPRRATHPSTVPGPSSGHALLDCPPRRRDKASNPVLPGPARSPSYVPYPRIFDSSGSLLRDDYPSWTVLAYPHKGQKDFLNALPQWYTCCLTLRSRIRRRQTGNKNRFVYVCMSLHKPCRQFVAFRLPVLR